MSTPHRGVSQVIVKCEIINNTLYGPVLDLKCGLCAIRITNEYCLIRGRLKHKNPKKSTWNTRRGFHIRYAFQAECCVKYANSFNRTIKETRIKYDGCMFLNAFQSIKDDRDVIIIFYFNSLMWFNSFCYFNKIFFKSFYVLNLSFVSSFGKRRRSSTSVL